MRITKKHLLRLNVVTQEGMRIGTVCDIVVDADSHLIVQYVVQPYVPFPRLLAYVAGCPPLLIGREQVVSMTDKELVVSNTVKNTLEQHRKRKPLNNPLPNPANQPLTRE